MRKVERALTKIIVARLKVTSVTARGWCEKKWGRMSFVYHGKLFRKGVIKGYSGPDEVSIIQFIM